MLGLVGGLATIIWSLLSGCLGGYSDFSLQYSLFSSVYMTSPPQTDSANDEKESKDLLARSVTESSPYSYGYPEYFLFSLLSLTCGRCLRTQECFKRRLNRINRYEDASERLENELDIVKLVKSMRILDFIARVVLKKHHRALVPHFKKHLIANLDESV